MNRSDLVEQLILTRNIPQKVSEKIVGTIFSSMADALVNEGRIEIRGFGSFQIKEYVGYTGRNPKTGLTVTVKPKKLPFFKVGKDLKDRIQDGGVPEVVVKAKETG